MEKMDSINGRQEKKSHSEEHSLKSDPPYCICVTFEDILAVLSCTVLADNGKSFIFFMISALFLKSRNSSSDALIKQFLTYSPSVNGFPLFAISNDTAKLARFTLLEDCAQLLRMELDCCCFFVALQQLSSCVTGWIFTSKLEMNIIEDIRDALLHAVEKRSPRPSTPMDLLTALKDSWCEFPPGYLQTPVESMLLRFASLLRARGGPTRY
ncbi:hypothetical protein AVEN_258097-1 [Araneus ventricosus]|uniref:Uncharacterized protein n=1 Tax=Araneus ventricosus TaxID=182803 RepID=A0A4Y2LG49_ARAVE|nr:hypothetical protein AVEN_258097-1 [Araneus ventricosus]